MVLRVLIVLCCVVSQGSNSAGSNCGEKGFSAAKGWDPVTGLGTPSYVRLAAAVATLP